MPVPDRYAPDPFSIDHIQPQSRGGPHRITNLAYACAGCNGRKHTATTAPDPATGQVAPLYDPRRDSWSDHFVWSADGAELLGLTAVGRATIARLELNRPHLINLRRLLLTIGAHPPAEEEEKRRWSWPSTRPGRQRPVAGDFAGATWGRAALPARWLAALHEREYIEQTAGQLARLRGSDQEAGKVR